METTHQGDIIRRGLRRDQPVKLTQDELLDKMKAFTVKDAERDELVDELARETKKRKQQIEDLDDEIGHLKRCIRTGEEDRSVQCCERLDRRADGTWEVVLIRMDTNAVVERRGASAAELQRHLPTEYSGSSSALDEARAQQQAAAERSAGGDDVPGDDVPDEHDAEDADGDKKPAGSNGNGKAKPKKPQAEKFDADLLARGNCALRFEGGNGCTLAIGHDGLHKSATHSWKARRPKPPSDEADVPDDGEAPPTDGMVAEALAKEQQP